MNKYPARACDRLGPHGTNEQHAHIRKRAQTHRFATEINIQHLA